MNDRKEKQNARYSLKAEVPFFSDSALSTSGEHENSSCNLLIPFRFGGKGPYNQRFLFKMGEMNQLEEGGIRKNATQMFCFSTDPKKIKKKNCER